MSDRTERGAPVANKVGAGEVYMQNFDPALRGVPGHPSLSRCDISPSRGEIAKR